MNRKRGAWPKIFLAISATLVALGSPTFGGTASPNPAPFPYGTWKPGDREQEAAAGMYRYMNLLGRPEGMESLLSSAPESKNVEDRRFPLLPNQFVRAYLWHRHHGVGDMPPPMAAQPP